MKLKLIAMGLLVFSMNMHASARVQVLQLDNGITTYLEEVPTDNNILTGNYTFENYRKDNELELAFEVIVNLAKKVWSLVEANKPVADIRFSYANALPQGLKSGEELQGFSDLQFRSMRYHGVNGFGMNVFDVTYTLIHRYGGNYDGVGKYLENVTVLPQKVSVLWGYNVSMAVEKISTVNVGTKASPIASLLMGVNSKVSTVLKTSEKHEVFSFRGDSAKVLSPSLDQY